jgi:predicted transcriptional regulator YheO
MVQNKEDYKKNIFSVYISMLDFLADLLGDHCEIVLHDLSNIDSSIIAIKNGHISGRKVGGPLGDLALKVLRTSSDKTHLADYEGKTSSGKKLKSSTYFLKDLEGEIFGMLCFNFDMTEIMAARNILSKMLGIVDINDAASEKVVVENFSPSIDGLISSITQETVNKFGSSPDRMTVEEKIW